MTTVLVAGGGGAIGGHLVKALLDQGHDVRAVDIKERCQWWQRHPQAHNVSSCDLRKPTNAANAVEGADWVFDLAENMGGIGFITDHRVECAESIEIGMMLLRAAARQHVQRFFFSSSACVYPVSLQEHEAPSLKEADAWPALPEKGYGFSKLYMEELCQYYAEEGRLRVRLARYHNVFGEHGSWKDGREKAPAALCRKIALAKLTDTGSIDVWGDGRQLRSYLHVEDCVRGTLAVMNSATEGPFNIGSDRAVSVNELVDIIAKAAEYPVQNNYVAGARGVNGRNADLTKARHQLGWEPQLTLEEGLGRLYRWIEGNVKQELGACPSSAGK